MLTPGPRHVGTDRCGDDKTGVIIFSGRAADLWALGVCLYMWMFHRLPFEAETVYLLMAQVACTPRLRASKPARPPQPLPRPMHRPQPSPCTAMHCGAQSSALA